MGCRAIQMWTISGLVGAFLDLTIAYLLLCASAVAYFASKFLGFFGLSLPCPCNGLLLTPPNRDHCFQQLLLDFPTQTASKVQLSVKQRFPFSDSIWANNQNGKEINGNVKGLLVEGEESCSSVSDTRMLENLERRQLNWKNDRPDVKGKRVLNYTRRGGFRRRRKGGIGGGDYSSASSYDRPLFAEVQDGSVPMSPPSINKKRNELSGGVSMPVDDALNFEYEEKAPTVMGLRHGVFDSIELNKNPAEEMHIKENVTFVEDSKENAHGDLGSNEDDKNTIRLLKQALEEEHAAGLALYNELEKERSAAATAADEAMAMILRLQEEKASIEMEARQYQRILEEKSAYDAEEMNILKEILVRREREKHFLEKEVEVYRKMNSLGDKQLPRDEGETVDLQLTLDSSIDPYEDPVLILQELSASIDKKVTIENKGSDDIVRNLQMPLCSSDSTVELQEKEMISVDDNTYMPPRELKESNFPETTIPPLVEKEPDENENFNIVQKNINSSNAAATGDPHDSHNDPHVYDVHVVGNGTKVTDTSEVERENEVDITRSCSDMTTGLPPMGPRDGPSISDTRRSSMSALDTERVKIESEIFRLRERLRIVQEGREKLGISVEHRERDRVQMELLENIANQLQEIRQLTEPGKAVRQASLPPPSSKCLSKKRRCRSVSSGLQRSS